MIDSIIFGQMSQATYKDDDQIKSVLLITVIVTVLLTFSFMFFINILKYKFRTFMEFC